MCHVPVRMRCIAPMRPGPIILGPRSHGALRCTPHRETHNVALPGRTPQVFKLSCTSCIYSMIQQREACVYDDGWGWWQVRNHDGGGGAFTSYNDDRKPCHAYAPCAMCNRLYMRCSPHVPCLYSCQYRFLGPRRGGWVRRWSRTKAEAGSSQMASSEQ